MPRLPWSTVVRLKLFDETLRDGEQQAGLFFAEDRKHELAHLIADTGVHRIDCMPAVDDGEERLAATLIADGFGPKLSAAVPAVPHYVEQAKSCGLERIILFYATGRSRS